MEYSVEMPSTRDAARPTMFMRYGNLDKSGRYLRDYGSDRPSYPSSSPEFSGPSIPPFPFALPYQYVNNRYPIPDEPIYPLPERRRWDGERDYPTQNEQAWEKVYHPREDRPNEYRESPRPRYFERQDGGPYSSPRRFTSTVDEIQNRVFSMMHGIGTFPRHPNGGGHRSGFSRESQFGYQMFI